ncbi:MAG: DUF5686 and carboxypeptidase regulatory-like domain-containing protein [Bacteroidota bacterium]
MIQRFLLLSYFIFLCLSTSFGQSIKGVVLSKESKEPLPYASVYVMNSSVGTYCDEEGKFEIEVESRQFILVVSLIGFEEQKIGVDTQKDSFVTVLLEESLLELNEAVVEGKKENVGKSIMKKVIANKAQVLSKETRYSADSYYRTSMEKWIEKSKKDTVEVEEGFQPVYLNENFARQHYSGKDSKREVKAELQNTGDDALNRRGRMALDFEFRGSNLSVQYNPLEYFRNPLDANIDLYENQINNSSLSDLPITSPLSDNAFLSYQYKLTDIQEVEGDSIYTIQVEPIFRQAPLFSGQLKIKKQGYLLKSADLEIRSNALTLARDFEFDIQYEVLTPNHWRPTERIIRYQSNYNGDLYQVETIVQESNFDFQPEFDKKFFNNEVIVYDVKALEKDTSVWQNLRPKELKLNVSQQKFLSEQDSIWRYEQSPEYYRIQDSIFNHNGILDFLFEGVGWTRREQGIRLSFNPLIASIQPLGVGGLRLSLGGEVEKKFLSTANVLDFDYTVNYGVLNEDWKGEVEVGYLYLPRRFARAYVRGGDTYELITFNTSVQALFSRSNFVRNVGFGAGHSFELSNGVYLTTEFDYADQQPIDGLELADWSQELFGELNEPVEFDRYRGLFLNFELLFKFNQQYITRGSEKIILGTRFPTLRLRYRKGVPNIGQSEVNFDQIEIEAYHRLDSKIGSSNWNAQAGGFLNQKSLRLLEYRFFRGSTPYFFVDPLRSFQLLGPNLSTPNAYMQAGLMHHFNGFILDKVPPFNLLQMEMLAGGAFLTIPDQKFVHGELFVGIGKKFRLFGEQVQFAIYGVTANNTFQAADISYKIGFNFFNAFSGEWSY